MVALIKRKLDSGYINIRQSRLLKRRLLPDIKKSLFQNDKRVNSSREKNSSNIYVPNSRPSK